MANFNSTPGRASGDLTGRSTSGYTVSVPRAAQPNDNQQYVSRSTGSIRPNDEAQGGQQLAGGTSDAPLAAYRPMDNKVGMIVRRGRG
jgi:hypothetical protein